MTYDMRKQHFALRLLDTLTLASGGWVFTGIMKGIPYYRHKCKKHGMVVNRPGTEGDLICPKCTEAKK